MTMIGSPKVEQHAFAYQGKDVEILVVRLITWDWVWSYEIDGGLPQANDAERYVSADDAIHAGMRAAMRAIDGDPPDMLH
jgi:hypothetical protein